MGRLDRRTAAQEAAQAAQEAAGRQQVSRAEQLRQAEAAAARTAEQEALVAEVYELVDEFLELMEEQDYPELETVTLPMTRWWWPFRIPTRKAAWTVLQYNGEKRVTEFPGYVNEAHDAEYTWYERVHLLPDGQLFYRLEPGYGSGYNQEKAAFHDWDGEHAQKVKGMLEDCVSFLRTGRSKRAYSSWPPAYFQRQSLRP